MLPLSRALSHRQQHARPTGAAAQGGGSSARQPRPRRPSQGSDAGRSRRTVRAPPGWLDGLELDGSASPAQGGDGEQLDPLGPGARERALLFGLLESLPPSAQAAMAGMMEREVAEMQQQVEAAPALEFVQRLMLKAAAAGQGPDEFAASPAGQAALWGLIKEQFSADEVALLDLAFGPDWAGFQDMQLSGPLLKKIESLEPAQQAMLANILSKASDMTDQMEALAQRLAEEQQLGEPGEPGTTATDSSSGGGAQRPPAAAAAASPPKRVWGRSLLRTKPKPSSKLDPAAMADGERYWDRLLEGQTAGRVQRMMALASQAARGQLQWGLPNSRQFQQLQQLHQAMLALEQAPLLAAQQQLQEGMGPAHQGVQAGSSSGSGSSGSSAAGASLSAQQVQDAYARISDQLNAIASQVDAEGDTASRSALLFMDALLNSPSPGPGLGQASSGVAAEPPGPPGQVPALGRVSLAALEELGLFLAAAANLEAFTAFLTAMHARHPRLASSEMLQASNLTGDDWFIPPPDRAAALAAAEAAASGAVQAGEAQRVASAVSAALRPYVDLERLRTLAALDAATLWFLAELTAAEPGDEADGVLLKWALHPSLGPKLTSGRWVDELALTPELEQLWRAAQVDEFMRGLDRDLAELGQ